MNGLRRIILVDSLFRGRDSGFEVDGTTSITGTNGAGKTSVAKLIPIFYGEEPRALVNTSAGKLHFHDYYLPHKNSLIVFEYERTTGQCCVVLSRHSSGVKHVYRFVSAPYSKELFSIWEGERRVFLPASDLPAHWARASVDHSRQYEDIKEYRCILQNDRPRMREAGQRMKVLSQDAMRYSMTPPGERMPLIQKAVSAVLNRKDSMKVNKLMVASILEENGVSIPPPPDHSKNKGLIAQIKGLEELRKGISEHNVMGHFDAYMLVLEELSITAHWLDVHNGRLMAEQTGLDAQLKALGEQSSKMAEDFGKWQTEHGGTTARLQGDIDDLERRITLLQEQLDQYEDQQMPSKRRELDGLPLLKDKADATLEAYQVLMEEVRDVEASRDKVQRSELERYQRIFELRSGRIEAMRSAIETMRTKHQGELDKLDTEKSTRLEEARAQRDALLHALITEEAVLAAQAEHCTADKAVLDHLALCDAALESAGDVLSLASAEVRTTTAEHEKVDHQRKLALAAYKAADASLAKATAERNRCHARLFPDKGSLLSVLRQDDPEWGSGLGKLIDPALLTRKDLSPEFRPESKAGYAGWHFDLTPLDPPEHVADEAVLRDRLGMAEEREKLEKEELELRESDLKKANQSVEKAALALNLARNKQDSKESQYEAARMAVRGARASVIESRQRVKEQFEEQLAKVRAEHQRVSDEQKALFDSLTSSFDAQILEAKSRHSIEMGDLKNNLDTENELAKTEHTEHQARIKDIRQTFEAQCIDRGVDEVKIREASSRQEQAKADYKRVAGYTEEVSRYEQWLKVEWPQFATHTNDKAEKERRLKVLVTDGKRRTRQHSTEMDELRAEKIRITTRKNTVDEELNQLASSRKSITASASAPAPGSACPELSGLHQQVVSFNERRKKLTDTIRTGLIEVQNLIGRSSIPSLGKAWEERCGTIDRLHEGANLDDDARKLNHAQALKGVYDEDIPAQATLLSASLNNIAGGCGDFYGHLNNFNNSLRGEEKRINQVIAGFISKEDGQGGRTPRIHGISEVAIGLESRVDEVEFWEALKAFVSAWESHLSSRTNDEEFPSIEVLEQLAEVVDMLERSRVSKNIEELFDIVFILDDQGRRAVIRTESELGSVSSNGLSYLAQIFIYLGFTRRLCSNTDTQIHWPVDELGVIHNDNVIALFELLHDAGVVMVGAFPNPTPELLSHFKHKHHIGEDGIVRRMAVKPSLLEEKLSAMIPPVEDKSGTGLGGTLDF